MVVLWENVYSKLEHLSRLSQRRSPLLSSCMEHRLFDVIGSLLFSVFLKNIFNSAFGERDLQLLWQLSQSNQKYGILLIKSKSFRHLCIYCKISEKHGLSRTSTNSSKWDSAVNVWHFILMLSWDKLYSCHNPREESFYEILLSNMNIWKFPQCPQCCANITVLIV